MRETASNYYISCYYHHAVKCGLDADSLLKAAGIGRDVIDVPTQRVDAEKLAMVVEAIWDTLQDEASGLSGSPIPRGSFYMMGKLTIHEANLAGAFEQIKKFYGLVTKAFTIQLRTEGDRAIFTCEMHYPEMDKQYLHAEINLMSWHRYSSWLIEENIPLDEIYFSYPAPKNVAEYAYLFPGKHVFNAPAMGFSFHKQYLDHECVQNRATLKTFMRACPVLLFLQPKTDFSLSGEIQLLLNRKIKDGLPTIDEAARYLHLTKRTLNRKLKEEGTSFQQIKDLCRRDRATNYLTRHSLTISAIAEKVGFSDPAVFARAFKSWTGLSPRAYRIQHAQSEAPEEICDVQ
ncbi:MAG: AraC family transcriptional regulator [Pseudomonadales bacterium]